MQAARDMAANATWGVHLYLTDAARDQITDEDDRVAEYSIEEFDANQLRWARELEARGQ
jgi:hypothetical protein